MYHIATLYCGMENSKLAIPVLALSYTQKTTIYKFMFFPITKEFPKVVLSVS